MLGCDKLCWPIEQCPSVTYVQELVYTVPFPATVHAALNHENRFSPRETHFSDVLTKQIRLWAINSDLFRTPFLKKVRIRTKSDQFGPQLGALL